MISPLPDIFGTSSASLAISGEKRLRESTAPVGGGSDDISLSAGQGVFGAVDQFFDLSRNGRFEGLQSLGAEDRKMFFKIVGTLLLNGYVGYETLVVNKKIERHDIALEIGDRRLKGAKPYRPDPRSRD